MGRPTPTADDGITRASARPTATERRLDPTGIALVVFAAAGLGTLGPLARFASDVGFSAAGFASWRAVSSVVALAAMLLIGLRMRRVATVAWASTTRLERIQLAAMGVFVTGTTLGLFSAFERTTIALALIVFYAYPTFVALVAVRLYGEPLGAARLGAILLATFGMALVVVSPLLGGGEVGIDLVGVAFALVAAACQAGYALTASRGFASVPALQASTLVRGFAMLLYLVFVVPGILLVGDGGGLLEPLGRADAWVLIVVAGAIGAALPTAALLAGYRRVGPTRGAVLMLFEPVVGVLLAALLLAERPAGLQLVGGLLVLVGAGLVQVLARSRPAQPAEGE